MKSLNLYGRFLAAANRKSWIDVLRVSLFSIELRDVSEIDMAEALDDTSSKLTAVWGVYCFYEKNSELVGIFSTQEEARISTEQLLLTAFGKSPKLEQACQTEGSKAPVHLSPHSTRR